jgi:hypothetical protein
MLCVQNLINSNTIMKWLQICRISISWINKQNPKTWTNNSLYIIIGDFLNSRGVVFITINKWFGSFYYDLAPLVLWCIFYLSPYNIHHLDLCILFAKNFRNLDIPNNNISSSNSSKSKKTMLLQNSTRFNNCCYFWLQYVVFNTNRTLN